MSIREEDKFFIAIGLVYHVDTMVIVKQRFAMCEFSEEFRRILCT